MLKQLVVLTLLSVAMLLAADAPPKAPVVKPIAVAEIDILRLQVQTQAMQLLEAAFQKLQSEGQRMQADYQVKDAARNELIKAIYEKAKVKAEDFELDLEHQQLIAKQKPAAAPAPPPAK